MQRQWVKKSDFNYTLWLDEREIGKMEIQFNTIASKAICDIDGRILEIKRAGFWKSNLEITDNKGTVILKTYPEKWYANSWVIEFENQNYKLLIRNNPLAEYVITENDKNILAYGLDSENRELKVRIATSENSNVIFDFLLWYLFLPVANENFGNTYAFFLSQ